MTLQTQTSATDVRPDSFRTDASFSAVLTLYPLVPVTDRKRSCGKGKMRNRAR